MELRDIEYFAITAEHGNLGRAAETLGLSTPALSKSLRRLEGALDAKMFRRSTRGVDLTPEGQAFLSHVKRLRLSLADAAREVANIRRGRAGYLRIGVTAGLLEELVGATCAQFFKDATEATLDVNLLAQEELLPLIREGKLDIAVGIISSMPTPDLVSHHLCDDEFVVFASPSHRLAHRQRVTLEDLTKERWIKTAATGLARDAFHKVFVEHSLDPPRTGLISVSAVVRMHSIESAKFLFFASKYVTKYMHFTPKLVELPIEELTYVRKNIASYRRDIHLPPIGYRFIEMLKLTAKRFAK